MQLIIRKVELADSEDISNLSGQLGYDATTDAISIRLSKLLGHNEHCVFLAVLNNTVVGWIHGFYTLRVESEPFVEIGGLVVHENFRGRNIGKLLMDEVAKWANHIDCSQLRVRCNVIRRESHHFYTAIGFTEIKEQKVFDKSLKA